MDEAKLLPLCRAIQEYYKSINASTQLLAASLTSTDEIFALAGAAHITIPPNLLEQLTQPKPENTPSLFDSAPTEELPAPGTSYLNDPGNFQITFSRDGNGSSHIKLTEVLSNNFYFQICWIEFANLVLGC